MTLQILEHLKHTVQVLYHTFNLKKYEQTKGRTSAIPLQDALALGMYRARRGNVTKKSIYDDLSDSLRCSYKTFVVTLNRWGHLVALLIFSLIQRARRGAHPIKHIDSTDIPVCLKKNADSHRTMAILSGLGRSSKGWFYGLKLHIVTDLKGRLLNLCFTPGNTDDRVPVKKLVADMPGIFIADAGYISQPLADELHVEGSRVFMARARRNMKKLMSEIQCQLYSTRMQIEVNFRNLKLFYGLVTSYPRSVNGYLSHYLYSILSYVLR